MVFRNPELKFRHLNGVLIFSCEYVTFPENKFAKYKTADSVTKQN